MKGKTKTILTVLIAILVFATAVVGTVTFLKDDGEASAAEEGVGNTLPITGTDNEQTNPDGEQNEAEDLEGEENPGEQPGENENPDEGSEEGTTVDGETTTGTTGNQGTTTGGQLEPEPTTIEQERLVSTTLNWSSISLNSTIGDTGINYTNLAYTIKYYQVVSQEEVNLLNTEAGIAEYASTVTVTEEQIIENCPEVGYKFDETSELSVIITENVEANLIEVYYIKDRFDLKVEYEYEDGTPAADPFEKDFEYEEDYTVESPEIPGYTPDKEIVEGTMPGEDTTITVTYKPNTDVSYTVKYLEKETEKVLAEEEIRTEKTFNETYKEEAKTVTGYTPELSEQEITLDAYNKVLTFYYTANEDVSYTVKYLEKGTEKVLAEEETRTEKTFNETYKEEAKTVTGYTPELSEQEITLDAYNKVLTFYYTANEDVSYTVKYLEKGTEKVLAEEETRTNKIFNETYKEEAKTVTGYTPELSGQEITLDAYNKVLTFYYTANEDVSYTVKYLEKGTEKVLAEGETRTNKTFNETYKEEAKVVTGYTPELSEQEITLDAYNKVLTFYYTANEDVSYTVKYLEKGTEKVLADEETRTNKTFNETYKEEAKVVTGYTPEVVEQEITLDAYNKVLTFYYTANEDVSYTVKYLEKGTEKVLAAEETRTNKTFNETYKEEAKVVTGYTPELSEQEITLDAYNKVLTFYYTANEDVSYTVKYLEKGTEKVLADEETRTNKTFNETYKEEAKVVTGYTPEVVEQEITLDAYNKVLTFYYTKNTYNYTVKYYYEGVDGEYYQDNYAPTYSAEYGTVISEYEPRTQNDNYVLDYVTPADENENAHLIISEKLENNVLEVYYKRNTFAYKVVYYKDSVNGEKLGETGLKKQKVKTVMTSEIVATDYGAEWLNEHKPQVGYQDGTVVDYITIQANDNNVIQVVYEPRKDIEYSVEYYFNNEPDTTGKNYSEKATFGATITEKDITDYSNNGEWTLESSNLPFEIVAVTGNIIKVYYVKPEITVEKTRTVNTDRTEGAANTVEPGETITYTITATNTGLKDGTVTIADKVPEGTTLVEGSITATGYETVTKSQLNTGIELTVPKQGGEASVTFTVTVTATVNNNIVNTPTVNGTEDTDNTVTNPVEKTVSVKAKSDNTQITNSNIVIVIDTSYSMSYVKCPYAEYHWGWGGYWTSEGCTNEDHRALNSQGVTDYYHRDETMINAAKTVTKEFIDKVNLSDDADNIESTVSVIQFDTNAELVGRATLSTDITNLKNSVTLMETNSSTNMAKALTAAKNEFSNLKQGNNNIVIFLSDGTPSDSDQVAAAAQALKGVATVYTVGFGAEADTDILQNTIASSTDKYFSAADGDYLSLSSAFQQATGDITGDPVPTQSEDGLIELTGVYADATHPIKITVNTTPLADITALPTDDSGKVIYKDGKYYLDLSKFNADDSISIEYFAE